MRITKETIATVQTRFTPKGYSNQLAVLDDRCNCRRDILIIRRYSQAFENLSDTQILKNLVGVYEIDCDHDHVFEDIKAQ